MTIWSVSLECAGWTRNSGKVVSTHVLLCSGDKLTVVVWAYSSFDFEGLGLLVDVHVRFDSVYMSGTGTLWYGGYQKWGAKYFKRSSQIRAYKKAGYQKSFSFAPQQVIEINS